jgi:hypothetical protein
VKIHNDQFATGLEDPQRFPQCPFTDVCRLLSVHHVP